MTSQLWPEAVGCKCGCQAVQDGPEPVTCAQEAEQDA